jgi:hypothetical protein
MPVVLLDPLYDMEKATVIMTTSGTAIEIPLDEHLSLSLNSLWQELGIQDLEAIE